MSVLSAAQSSAGELASSAYAENGGPECGNAPRSPRKVTQSGGENEAAEGLYDLGYLTDGVAAYITSLRERVSRTQADLLTVPAQELRSALQVRSKS